MTRNRRIAVELLVGALLVAAAVTAPRWTHVVKSWTLPALATGTRAFEGEGVRFEYPPLYVEDVGVATRPPSLLARHFTRVIVQRVPDLADAASWVGCERDVIAEVGDLVTAPQVFPDGSERSLVERAFGGHLVQGVRGERRWPGTQGRFLRSATEVFPVPVGGDYVLLVFTYGLDDQGRPLDAQDEVVGLVGRTFTVAG